MVDTAAGVDAAAVGHELIGAAGALTNEEIAERLDGLFHEKATVEGAILVLLGEVDRRQAYRDDGATSSEAWAVERFGVSTPTARAYAHLADKAWEIPHLMGALCAGDLTLDKVRAVADVGDARRRTAIFVSRRRSARSASSPTWPAPMRRPPRPVAGRATNVGSYASTISAAP